MKSGKKLITQGDLDKLCVDGSLSLERWQILTPGAKDKIQEKKIKLSFVDESSIKADQGNGIGEKENPESSSDPSNNNIRLEKSIIMPSINLLGHGCLQKAVERIGTMGFRKGLIVTDSMLNEIGIVRRVTDMLEQNNISVAVYDEVQPNPTISNVEKGLTFLIQEKCDFIISLGGGSPHDCAKGISLLFTNGGSIEDYEGVEKSTKPGLPLISINTTAGTASEMTRFCVITNEATKVKMTIVDPHVTPLISVNDSQLMLGLPAGLTAATGMDALTHAIEAYLSVDANPMTDAVACKAIGMIAEYLPLAVSDGNNEKAREQMACAQFMAGVAFNNAGLGLVHAMAHQLGGRYGLPHGVCNAVLLPHVMVHNLKSCEKRMSDIARELGCNIHGLNHRMAAVEGIKMICELLAKVGMPVSLTELGVLPEDISDMAENAMQDACTETNPRKVSKADIESVFHDAMLHA